MKESPKVGTSQKTADTTKTYIQPTIGAWVKDLKKKKGIYKSDLPHPTGRSGRMAFLCSRGPSPQMNLRL